MFIMTLVGSLLSHLISAIAVSLSGVSLPLVETLQQITLPSLILNLLLAAPVYAVIKDLAEWVYPEEIEI